MKLYNYSIEINGSEILNGSLIAQSIPKARKNLLEQIQIDIQEDEKCPSCGQIPDNFSRCKCCNKDAF